MDPYASTVPVDGSTLRQQTSACAGLDPLRQRSNSSSGADLEAWLAEESQWQQARSEEVPRHHRAYRVSVPANYPGVQYRRSRNLRVRYYRYAQAGSIVHGVE